MRPCGFVKLGAAVPGFGQQLNSTCESIRL